MTKWGCIVAIGLLVAGCGGGGGGGQPPDEVNGAPPPVEPPPVESDTALLFSDLLFSESGATNEERVENIECPADLSSCTATFQGTNLTFATDPNAEGEGTAYTSLGDWAHIYPVVVEVEAEGFTGRMASVGGRTYADSLPVALGSATWQGTMVALDPDHQVVRGGATLTIPDLAMPAVDVELTPEGHARMTWPALSVTGGAFSARATASDYLKGAFYGPEAQEVGGVFERNRLLGAFGATR